MGMKRGLLVGLAFAVAVLSVMPAGTPAAGAEGRRGARTSKIKWSRDVDKALAKAAKENKIVMVDFMADWCPPCRAMEDTTFCDAAVVAKAKLFIPVRINVDTQKEVALRYKATARKYGGIGIPNMLFMKGDETKLKHIIGFYGPGQLVAVMDSVLSMGN